MTSKIYKKTDIILQLDNIGLTFQDSKTKKDKVILRDVNLNVQDIQRPGCCQGQIESIIAPSGMGKTQLLKIIAGLQKQTNGTVQIGHPLRSRKTGDIGVVQQTYPLFFNYRYMKTWKLPLVNLQKT